MATCDLPKSSGRPFYSMLNSFLGDERMRRYVVRACLRFVLGGIIGAAGILVFPLSLLTYPLGGAISGASLGQGRRTVIGFAGAFFLLGFMIPLAMISLQGARNDSQMFFAPIVMYSLSFGVTGVFALALSGLDSKMLRWALAGCGVAGAVGGAVTGGAFVAFESFSRVLGIPMLIGAMVVALLISHALMGALFATALKYPTYKRIILGLCLNCGYDLRGSLERCPECGEVIDPVILSARSSAKSD